MKRIEVAAAIIIKDRKVYATQRGYGEWQGWWEFPGGKIEPGEQPQDACVACLLKRAMPRKSWRNSMQK